MSETVFAAVFAIVGLVVLCFSSVLLAIKVRGAKVITWRGFGVAFTMCPCRECPLATRPQHITDQIRTEVQ